jgi:hypothetical protein
MRLNRAGTKQNSGSGHLCSGGRARNERVEQLRKKMLRSCYAHSANAGGGLEIHLIAKNFSSCREYVIPQYVEVPIWDIAHTQSFFLSREKADSI